MGLLYSEKTDLGDNLLARGVEELQTGRGRGAASSLLLDMRAVR